MYRYTHRLFLCVVHSKQRSLCPEVGGFMHTHCLHWSCQTQVGVEPLPCKQHGAPVVQRQGELQHRAVRQPLPGVATSMERAVRAPVGRCL